MMGFKYLKDKDSWMLAEHFPNVDFFFAEIWLSSFVNNLKKACGRNYKKVLAVFHPKFYIHFYYGQKDSLAFERHLVKKIKNDPKFGILINKNIVKLSDRLKKFSKEISRFDFKKMTNQDLSRLIKEQDDIHTHLYEWGWLSNATDMFHGSFTTELENYLRKKLTDNQQKNLNKIFNILTTPHQKSVAALEEENLLKIASLIRKKTNKSIIEKAIKKHQQKYGYLKHLWLGNNGTYSKRYYFNLAKRLAQDKVSPEIKIIKENNKLKKIKKEKERLFDKLGIAKAAKDLFLVYSDFMLTKIYRRYAQIFWAYQLANLLKEISHRLGLTIDEVHYLTVKEIEKALLGDIDKKEVKKRLNFFLYYTENGRELLTTNKNHPLLKSLKPKAVKKIKELIGQIGCLGKAKGRVKIVNLQKDIRKMKRGEILVSIATNPDLVSAMKKAAAIVTEQGGVTSHAAIVSRELGIPCVIGTKIATKVLKDGDLVEVDATKGIVRKI